MTAPTLSVTSSNSSTITLHFSETVRQGYGNIVISDGSSQTYLSGGHLASRIVNETDGRVLEAGDNQITYSGQDVVIHLSSALKAGLTYSVTMGYGAVWYGVENGFDAIHSTKLYSFTTSGSSGATPSAVVGNTIHFIDNGSSATDYVTSISAQTATGTFTGTLGANDFVQVSLDNGATWGKATVSGNTWSYSANIDLDNLVAVNGDLGGALLARVSNLAGKSTAQAGQSYTYNGGDAADTAVLSGRALSLTSDSDTGYSDDDGITRNADTVELSVANLHGFHVGDKIEIIDTSNGGAIVGSYVLNSGDFYYGGANGADYISVGTYNSGYRSTIEIGLTASLNDGTHALAARMVDKNGIVSSALSNTAAIKLDTVVPQLSSSTPTENNASVDAGTTELVFHFNENIAIEDGAVVSITDDNNPNNTQDVTLHGSDISGGTLTIQLTSPLTSGTSYTVRGVAIADLAGNVGITGDTPLLHFTTAGSSSGGGNTPVTPALSIHDTAPVSDTDNGSALHNDGTTNDLTIQVSGLDNSGDWYYKLGEGDWQPGSGSSFELGNYQYTYASGEIQVKQVVDGVTSLVGQNSAPVMVKLYGPTINTHSEDVGDFAAGANSIGGRYHDAVDFPNETVEITFDNGATWKAATSSLLGNGAVDWSLTGISALLGNYYGMRVSDQAGNSGGNTAYYLASGGVTFQNSGSHMTVYGGNGADDITVGDNNIVMSGGGDTIHSGSDTTVIGGANTTVVTGNGNNDISLGAAATITTGTGDDIISLVDLTGTTVNAGAGKDTLMLFNTPPLSLASMSSSFQGIDVIKFGSGGDLTIGGIAAVATMTDSNHLTIESNGSSTVHLNLVQWTKTGTDGTFDVYHDGQNGGTGTILIGQNITVTGMAA